MKTTLYLGTDPTQFESHGQSEGHLVHYPVIQIVPRDFNDRQIKRAYDDLDEYTHFIFTSKNAVKVFAGHLSQMNKLVSDLQEKTVIAIGEVTAAHLAARGLPPSLVCQEETQEGVIHVLNDLNLDDAYIFVPRSSLSRPVLVHYFKEREIRCQACDLYDTVPNRIEPKPDLSEVDEIVFTSPSTVTAFLEIFGALPIGKKCLAIGPVTESALRAAHQESALQNIYKKV